MLQIVIILTASYKAIDDMGRFKLTSFFRTHVHGVECIETREGWLQYLEVALYHNDSFFLNDLRSFEGSLEVGVKFLSF